MATAPITAVTNSATALGNLILVTPQTVIGYQPQNQTGQAYNAPPILFHYEGEQTATVESDITDHYTEDNTAIQDQIALKPVTITTQGFIGELNDLAPNAAFQAAQVAAAKLSIVGAYAPELSITAQLAYNEAFFAYQTAANLVNNAVSAYNSINGTPAGETVISGTGISSIPAQTQQQKYFQIFYGYWNSRTLFTLQTPWAIFTDMAIKSLRAIQSAETNVITDFEVTFKQIRYATILTEAFVSANTQTPLTQQSSAQVNTGTSSLSQNPVTFAPNATVSGQ